MDDMKTLRAEAEAFCRENLAACCNDEIEYQDTGLLSQGKLRELAALCEKYTGKHDAMQVAQSLVKREAMIAARRQPDAGAVEDVPQFRHPSCTRPNVACAYPECGDDCRHKAATTPASPVPASVDGDHNCRRCNAYATMTKSLESQLSRHRADAAKYREAVDTLASEREANARLTAELEAIRALAEVVPEQRCDSTDTGGASAVDGVLKLALDALVASQPRGIQKCDWDRHSGAIEAIDRDIDANMGDFAPAPVGGPDLSKLLRYAWSSLYECHEPFADGEWVRFDDVQALFATKPAQGEKNATHADWLPEIEMYQPTVVLVEKIERAQAKGNDHA